MAITTPTTRPAIWAETGDTTAPSTGEQQSGYIVGKPSRRKTNWLLNWIDNAVQYLLSCGIPAWSVSETYPPSARVQHNTYMWQNVCGSNLTGVEPGTDATKWLQCGYNENDMAVLLSNKMRFTDIPAVTANYDGVIYSAFRYFVGGWISGTTMRVAVVAFKVALGGGNNFVTCTIAGGAALFPTGQFHITLTPAATNSGFYESGLTTVGADFVITIQQSTGTGGACWVRIEGYGYVP
jgi:hypothetical protein